MHSYYVINKPLNDNGLEGVLIIIEILQSLYVRTIRHSKTGRRTRGVAKTITVSNQTSVVSSVRPPL